MKEIKDKFEEHSCEFKNEQACEEELDEEEISLEEVDKEHFDEDAEER